MGNCVTSHGWRYPDPEHAPGVNIDSVRPALPQTPEATSRKRALTPTNKSKQRWEGRSLHPRAGTTLRRNNSLTRCEDRGLESDAYKKFDREIEQLLQRGGRGRLRNPRVDGLRQSIRLPCGEGERRKPGKDGPSHEQIDNVFEFMSIIGHGSFCRVVRVRNKSNGKFYAMKIMDKKALSDKGPIIYDQIRVERGLLNLFDHKFIVRLIFDFETEKRVFLVMELLKGRTLAQEKLRHRHFGESLVRLWAAEIVLALEHMHKNNVVYRDLKPDNLMIDSEGHIRIIDLGISRKLITGEKVMDIYGGHGFKSPEMLKETSYDYSTDWWNLGVIMYTLIVGKHPYHKFDNRDKATKDGHPIRYPLSMSDNCFDLISNLLKVYPGNRIGSRRGVCEIKRHPFFADIDWVKLRNKEIDIPFDPKVRDFSDSGPQFPSFRQLLVEFRRLDALA